MTEKKTYSIEVITTNDKMTMNRTNDGFNPYELIGILEFIQQEIVNQLKGGIKPEMVTRRVVKPKGYKEPKP